MSSQPTSGDIQMTTDTAPDATASNPIINKKTREQVVLAKNGDVILQTDNTDFLVTSYVLEIASSVFMTMFKPTFIEGRSHRSEQEPLVIQLPDDDTRALNLLLRGLHHKLTKNIEFPNVELLFALTRLCDKYDVMNAMEANLLRWFQACMEIPVKITKPDISSLLRLSSVAYMMGGEQEFRSVTTILLQTVTGKNCPDVQQYDLPYEFEVHLQLQRLQLQNALMFEVHSSMALLSLPEREYVLQSYKICNSCGVEKSLSTKTCRRCKGYSFSEPPCSTDSRLCTFIRRLSSRALIPLLSEADWSASIIQSEIDVFCSQDHRCTGNRDCPFTRELERLRGAVSTAMERFDGFDLKALKSLYMET